MILIIMGLTFHPGTYAVKHVVHVGNFYFNPSAVTVSPESGTSQFTVVSNTSWTAVSNAGWCTVTPPGNGNGNIIVVYSNNSTPQSRTAEISFTVAGLPLQTVTLIQEASTVGITEGDAPSYLIFPNPSKSSFMIRYPEERQIPGEISLLDGTGQISAL